MKAVNNLKLIFALIQASSDTKAWCELLGDKVYTI